MTIHSKSKKTATLLPETIKQLMNEYGGKEKAFLFAVDFELSEGYFVNPLNPGGLFFCFPNLGNKPKKNTSREGTFSIHPISLAQYRQKFSIVSQGLHRGDSYLTNLTIKTPIDCTFDLYDIFLLSQAPYQLYVPGRFVCFSPERFVLIKNGFISTNPMKGTIDASLPSAAEKILADFKEKAEHNTIVDLLRNDVSIWAKNVNVKRFRYLDQIKTRNREILQVSSEIEGQLPSGYLNHLGDIIFDMLPAGSCSGAPKTSTVKLIQEAEKEKRGYYTGVFGLFDGKTLDSAVSIRFIEEIQNQKFFRSGGGITANSKVNAEYREVLEKIYLPFI